MKAKPNHNEFTIFAPDQETAARLQNFYDTEDEFCWSSGKWCEIIFDVPAGLLSNPAIVEIDLDLDAFKISPDLLGQDVFIYLNGLRLASRHVTSRHLINLRTDGQTLRLKDNVLTIDTPDSVMPTQYGLKDNRTLGIQLFSIAGRVQQVASRRIGKSAAFANS